MSAFQINCEDSLLQVRSHFYEVHWDLARGGVLSLLRENRSGTSLIEYKSGEPAPDIVVSVSERLEDEPREVRLSALGAAEVEVFQTPDNRTTKLVFKTRGEEILIERELTLRADSPWIEERVAIQNVSDRDLLIDRYPDWAAGGKSAVAGDLFDWRVNPGGVDYVLAGLSINNDWKHTEYVTPACGYPFFHNRGLFHEMGDIALSLIAGHHGAILPCVMAWNEKAGSGVLLSCLHDRCLRYLRMAGHAASQSGSIAAQVWWARWLAPREKQEVATWQIVPFAGDYSVMLDEYRHWLADVHRITPPQDASAKLDEVFVAYLHPIVMNAMGDMEKLCPYVDVAAEVGCTAIWAGGEWLDNSDVVEGSVLSRCQPQTRENRYAITYRYGGEASRQRLVDYMHERGLNHVVWLTGYGLSSFDPIYQDHPEAFIRLRRPVDVAAESPSWPGYDFRLGRTDPWVYPPFGGPTVGSDTTHSAWRSFWLHNQEYWSARGVDGVFFDSFNPMPPNYALRPWPGQVSLEIINLQREARRLAKQNNPDFFTFTEGGGYLMATVNDFTHAWHGSSAPPLPPFRNRPLGPEEEARFCRDEEMSQIPGARSWASIEGFEDEQRPRVLLALLGGKMPVLSMFTTGTQSELIVTETDFWAHWKPHPAETPDKEEAAHWRAVGDYWRLRQSHPELKSGSRDSRPVQTSDAAVHAFLRRKGDDVSLAALNFRRETVTCTVRVDISAIGIAPQHEVVLRDLLRGEEYSQCTGEDLQNGYALSIPARDAIVLKLK